MPCSAFKFSRLLTVAAADGLGATGASSAVNLAPVSADQGCTFFINFTAGSLTNATFTAQGSLDGTNWYTLYGENGYTYTTGALSADGSVALSVSGSGVKFLRISYASTGTATSSAVTVDCATQRGFSKAFEYGQSLNIATSTGLSASGNSTAISLPPKATRMAATYFINFTKGSLTSATFKVQATNDGTTWWDLLGVNGYNYTTGTLSASTKAAIPVVVSGVQQLRVAYSKVGTATSSGVTVDCVTQAF